LWGGKKKVSLEKKKEGVSTTEGSSFIIPGMRPQGGEKGRRGKGKIDVTPILLLSHTGGS